MTAPRLQVLEVELRERPVHLRLPFKFGVVTLSEAPQAFVRARVRLEDGREARGRTAELMVPKWFDKDPDLSNADNFDQLRGALHRAAETYVGSEAPTTAFGLSAGGYDALVRHAGEAGLNPLAAAFGPAVLDKAVLDALCRALGVSFQAAVRGNLVGLEVEPLAPDLSGFDLDGFLRGLAPATTIHARHTVGMADPLTAADQAETGRVDDGLPETLEEVIDAYGHRYFKIKVGGALAEDLERLAAIAAVLDPLVGDYVVTLDGNEQFDDVDGILELWRAMAADPALSRLCGAVRFIEQPIKRAVALDCDVRALAAHRPVIIDESDGEIDAFLRARDLGYAGVSSKTCKGLYKSMLNAARCRMWNTEAGREGFFLSGEDLTCQAGIAVQQDLALVALLGIDHVERNGHHYVKGMAGASEGEQSRFIDAHPDLYTMLDGQAVLRIEQGDIALGSLDCPGYAVAAEPDWTSMDAMKRPEAPAGRRISA